MEGLLTAIFLLLCVEPTSLLGVFMSWAGAMYGVGFTGCPF